MDEILNLIESVSEGFPSYFPMKFPKAVLSLLFHLFYVQCFQFLNVLI